MYGIFYFLEMTENKFYINAQRILHKTIDIKPPFMALLAIVILVNSFQLFKEITKMQKIRRIVPFYFSGSKFLGLEGILKNVKYIGYYTNKDFSVTQNVAQFSEAQYVLAPSILELNNTDHDFILFDCTTVEVALAKIKEMRAIPLKKNQYGIILARKIR